MCRYFQNRLGFKSLNCGGLSLSLSLLPTGYSVFPNSSAPSFYMRVIKWVSISTDPCLLHLHRFLSNSCMMMTSWPLSDSNFRNEICLSHEIFCGVRNIGIVCNIAEPHPTQVFTKRVLSFFRINSNQLDRVEKDRNIPIFLISCKEYEVS